MYDCVCSVFMYGIPPVFRRLLFRKDHATIAHLLFSVFWGISLTLWHSNICGRLCLSGKPATQLACIGTFGGVWAVGAYSVGVALAKLIANKTIDLEDKQAIIVKRDELVAQYRADVYPSGT